MYRGFVGTFFSHVLSLMTSVWAIMVLNEKILRSNELTWMRISFLFIITNSILGLIRYGSSNFGYKLRNFHILTLNLSTIISFTIVEIVLHCVYRSPRYLVYTPLSNTIPFLCNLLNKDYRTKTTISDGFIGLNSVILSVMAYLNESYFAIALNFTHIFGYFVVGDCGFVFDTELPAVDAYQYLTCFLNAFIVYTFALLEL